MSTTLDPERHWKPDGDEAPKSPRVTSEIAPREPAGPVGSLAVPICSLPVSSAEAFSRGLQLLATEQREIAASHYTRGDHGNANACGVIADVYAHIDENFRRLMGLPTERQPEENDKAQTRAADRRT